MYSFFRRCANCFIPTRETFRSNFTRAGAVLGAASGVFYGLLSHSINVSCQVGKYVYDNAREYGCTFVGSSKDLCQHTGEGDIGYHFKLEGCSDAQMKQLFSAGNAAVNNSWTSTDIKTICTAILVSTTLLTFIGAKVGNRIRQQRENANAAAAAAANIPPNANPAGPANPTPVAVEIKGDGKGNSSAGVESVATPQTPLLGVGIRSNSQSSLSSRDRQMPPTNLSPAPSIKMAPHP